MNRFIGYRKSVRNFSSEKMETQDDWTIKSLVIGIGWIFFLHRHNFIVNLRAIE
jgi:hypothetical protein